MWENWIAIGKAMTLWVRTGLQLLWLPKNMGSRVRCKICRILSNVILEQILFEFEKWPFENWVSDMLKLNGKLFRFTHEGTYIYDIQNNFFKKADPQPPDWHALKIYLWKELLLTEKIYPSKSEVPFLYPMKT